MGLNIGTFTFLEYTFWINVKIHSPKRNSFRIALELFLFRMRNFKEFKKVAKLFKRIN